MTKKQTIKISFLAYWGILLILLFTGQADCSARTNDTAAESEIVETGIQSMVMDLADEYIAFLGEAVYLLMRNEKLDPKARWLAQSFLRNGVGACLDIAVGPNPRINFLDLMVLSSLKTWAFENHWIPSGIGSAGIPALEKLKQAEKEIWDSAGKHISKDQQEVLRELIEAWISENSDRTVVSLVRFSDFSDERRISSSSLREKASGLLKEVSRMRASVDDAVLLGERLMWFAGRYPYLLGEQTELTAYRLIDQPEGAQIIEAVESIQVLSENISKKLKTIDEDIRGQQEIFFANLTAERDETINHFFTRLTGAERQFLDDIAARQKDLLEVMTELHKTISGTSVLARELTETVNAIDRVVGRFDTDPNLDQEPLKMTDIRDVATETGIAADKITKMLDRSLELIESEYLDQKALILTQPMNAVVNRAFWLGVILVFLLITGLYLVKVLTGKNPNLK